MSGDERTCRGLHVDILLAVVIGSLWGCKKLDPILGAYSGQFVCKNHSSIDIDLYNCTGFGFGSPQCGHLSRKVEKAAFFRPLEKVPKETTFQW